jgi:hypothetical protein
MQQWLHGKHIPVLISQGGYGNFLSLYIRTVGVFFLPWVHGKKIKKFVYLNEYTKIEQRFPNFFSCFFQHRNNTYYVALKKMTAAFEQFLQHPLVVQ